jgi:Outer membrane receptor for ferrienterochelin and colicins
MNFSERRMRWHQRTILKLLVMTKLTLFLLIMLTVQSHAFEGFAQGRVSIKMHNVPVKTLIKEIERQTDMRFVYNDDALDGITVPRVAAHNQDWNSLLAPVLWRGGLSFEQLDGNIVVIKTINPDRTARQTEIKGVVVTTAGQPIAGVTVVEKGTGNGVSTNEDGTFSLAVANANATLVFTMIGYVTQELIPSASSVRIVMEEDLSALDEVVVVGYGTQRKANLTGAVSTVNMDDVLADRPVSNAAQALQGAVPGLQITTNSGQPGTGSGINIRGFTSINGGDPLVLVDNVPMNMPAHWS